MKKKRQPITTIEDLATLMQGEFLVIHDRFDGLRTELKGEINGLRTELKGEISELRTELKEEVSELREELKEEIHEVRVIAKRIDTRTQNQVDAVYEDTAVLKTDVKGVKKDIFDIKTHIGMKA